MSVFQLFGNRVCYKNKIAKWLTLVLVLASPFGFAQTVQYYSFSQSSGAYTELSSPTEIVTATAQSGVGVVDDNVYTLPDNTIPFDFSFNGTNYTGLNVYANGFLSFGSVTTNNSTPISSSVAYDGVISPFAADLIALYNVSGLTGNIAYQVLGTTPNREFVVQWSHFTPYSYSGYATSRYDLNFQVRLHENGTITFVYDGLFTGTPSATNAKVGLRGTSSSDYTNRTASGNTSSNWNSTTQGTGSSNGIATNYSYSLPTSGLTFTWTPPVACIAPTSQPTDLVLTNTGIIINGSFTASNPEVDRYLILRNISGTTPDVPVNGTIYTTGQNTDLNSYVAYYGTSTTFENNYNNGIRGNNEYVYTIYSVNSNCEGGPLYYTENPLTGTITNCPISLNGITAGTATTDSFVLSWPVGENGEVYTMSRVIEVATDSNFTNMVAGSPFTLTASDLTLTVSGLEANTQYYYRGKNVTSLCESAYSSTGDLYTACLPVLEFFEGFDGISTGANLPNCWGKILVGSGSYTPTINITPTSDYVYSAPNGVTFYGNGADMTSTSVKAILVSPQLTNVSAGTHRLRFRAKKSTASGTHAIRVVALSSNTADATIEVVGTIPTTELTNSWQQFSVNFDSYTGTASYVGIQRIDGATYSYMAVDDVIWEEIPACADLQNLTATNPTVNGVTLSWGVNGAVPANGYEYFISQTNSIPSETETFIASEQDSVTVSDLSASTTYYVFIRSVCSATEKGAWETTTFSTVYVASLPWQEEFLTSVYPQGWTTAGWTLGTVRGATGTGNSAMNLYKNLYGSSATGNFTTVTVGPLTTADYELSFYYKQSAYNSPNAPLATWGDFTVEVSADFGVTWTTLGTVDNEAGTGEYIQKIYSLEDYEGEYVQVKITTNRTAGDFDMSFDNFEIKQQGDQNPFCLPVYEYNSNGNMITQVIFNTIDQTSPFTSGTTPDYEDFTSVSTDVEQGSTHQISVTGPSSTYPSDVMVYIDFNQNGDFSDDGEGFYIGRIEPANPANALTITSDIVIPNDALTGTTKIRIVKNTNIDALSNPQAPNSISGPCADDLRSGQVEEYSVNITESSSSDCNNTEPGLTIGDTGCISFTYNGEVVSYTTVRGADGNIWLQQNLGSSAVAEVIDDENSYGGYFQWGRWVDGHQNSDSETTPLTPTPNNPMGIANGLNTFITNSWWSGNALTDEWTASDVVSISETNGCDPCKALGEGWALPSQEDWTALVDAEDFNNPEGAFASTLKLPANGYRSSSSGGFSFVGQRGYYWSSTSTGIGGKYLYVGTTLANPAAGAMRGQGAAIRCVKLAQTNGVVSVEVMTQNNVSAEITTENGTLQLVATINPSDANQEVIWSIESGSDFASVDADGLVTAISNGTATVRATSVEDETIFDEIEVIIGVLSTGNFTLTNVIVYPNPTTGIVNIQANEEVSGIKVFNIAGQLILQGSSNTLNLDKFNSGIYLIQVTLKDNSVHTHKLIKK